MFREFIETVSRTLVNLFSGPPKRKELQTKAGPVEVPAAPICSHKIEWDGVLVGLVGTDLYFEEEKQAGVIRGTFNRVIGPAHVVQQFSDRFQHVGGFNNGFWCTDTEVNDDGCVTKVLHFKRVALTSFGSCIGSGGMLLMDTVSFLASEVTESVVG